MTKEETAYQDIIGRYEMETREMNKYINHVLNRYVEQGIKPSPEVREQAAKQYILAQINKIKGAKNVKRTTRKNNESTSSK